MPIWERINAATVARFVHMDLEYIVVTISGLCLLGIVAALIFNQSFRQDLTAQPGKVSLFGVSVEGVVVVLLAALMIGALLYSLENYTTRMAASAQASVPSVRLVDLPFSAKNSDEAIETIKKLSIKASETPMPDVVALVRDLTYGSKESEAIRTFPSSEIGPWSTADTAKETHLTVPSNMKVGEVRGCPNQLGNKYELRSRLPDDSTASSERVEVEVKLLITRARDCEQIYEFIQVSCDIAQRVLSESVVTCDKSNQPGWMTKEKKIPIWLTRVSA